MRPDVKFGVVLSMGVVLVAGGYFIYRGNNEASVPVANGTDALTGQLAQKTPETTPAQPVSTGADRSRRTSPTSTAAGRTSQPGPGRVARSSGQEADGANRAQPLGTRPRRADSGATTRHGGSTPAGERGSGNTPPRVGASPAGQPRSGEGGGARTATVTPRPRPDAENQPNDDRGSRLAPAGNATTAQTGPAEAQPNSKVADATQRQPGTDHTTPGSSAQHRAAPPNRSITLTGTQPPTSGAGNQPSAADRLATADANAAVDMHLVQMGDTLSSLARRYYGSERYTQLLIDSNSHLADPNHLAIGSRVKIPPMPPDAPARTSSTAALSSTPTAQTLGSTTAGQGSPTPAKAQGRTYRVQSGDSFYSIARDVLHNHARWSELFELNKELVKGDARNLQIGQVIKLPPS